MDIRIAPEAAVQAASVGSALKPPSIPPVPPPPAVANISPFGDLLGRLRELSDASPVALHQLASQLGDALHQAAQRATGPMADVAAELAAHFGEVSRTGSLAGLQSMTTTSSHGQDVAAPVAALLAPHVDAALQAVRAAR